MGNVTLYLIMNSSIINITDPSIYGLSTDCTLPNIIGNKFNGQRVFCISEPLGLNGIQISFPVILSGPELAYVENNNFAYLQTQFTTVLNYRYEENSFIPISLQTENYYLR